MYFPTYDGYSDTNDAEDYVCFICLETVTLITLKMIIPNNDCSCDVVCHEECLKTWFKMNRTCPICRIHLKDDEQDDYNDIDENIYIHIFFVNRNFYFSMFILSLRVFKILCLLFYIWFLLAMITFSYSHLDLTPSGVVKRGY